MGEGPPGRCSAASGPGEQQGPAADGVAGPELDARVLRVIRRYVTPDRNGWTMAPADILYRLTAWHHIDITRAQLAEVLRTRAYLRE